MSLFVRLSVCGVETTELCEAGWASGVDPINTAKQR